MKTEINIPAILVLIARIEQIEEAVLIERMLSLLPYDRIFEVVKDIKEGCA